MFEISTEELTLLDFSSETSVLANVINSDDGGNVDEEDGDVIATVNFERRQVRLTPFCSASLSVPL